MLPLSLELRRVHYSRCGRKMVAATNCILPNRILAPLFCKSRQFDKNSTELVATILFSTHLWYASAEERSWELLYSSENFDAFLLASIPLPASKNRSSTHYTDHSISFWHYSRAIRLHWPSLINPWIFITLSNEIFWSHNTSDMKRLAFLWSQITCSLPAVYHR